MATPRPDVATTSWGMAPTRTARHDGDAAIDGRPQPSRPAADDDPTNAADAEVRVRWEPGVLAVVVLGAAMVAALLLTHEPASPGTVVAVGGGFTTVLLADDPRVEPGDTVLIEDANGAATEATVDASSQDPTTEGVSLVLETQDPERLALEEAPVVDVTFPARSVARSLVGR
jgi:hypothetical protein